MPHDSTRLCGFYASFNYCNVLKERKNGLYVQYITVFVKAIKNEKINEKLSKCKKSFKNLSKYKKQTNFLQIGFSVKCAKRGRKNV